MQSALFFLVGSCRRMTNSRIISIQRVFEVDGLHNSYSILSTNESKMMIINVILKILFVNVNMSLYYHRFENQTIPKRLEHPHRSL